MTMHPSQNGAVVRSTANAAGSSALALHGTATGSGALMRATDSGKRAIPRTSSLAAPIMQLSGHVGEIYAVQFSADGKHLASASHDKTIGIWSVHGDCKQQLSLTGHQGPVLDLKWFKNSHNMVSVSADFTVCLWDMEANGERIRRWKGHQSYVQSVAVSPVNQEDGQLCASGADDGYIKIWDSREKYCVATIQHPWPVTALSFNASGEMLFVGSIDNNITPYDIRYTSSPDTAGSPSTTLPALLGHTDTITCLRLSPDGTQLMSNAQDNSVRIWDVKPFSGVPGRQIQILQGAVHGFDKNLIRGSWSPDGSQVACGSADRTVCVWDITTAKLLYKLPGHKGTVNDVDWHPTEPILASGSIDKTIFLGEINAPSEYSYNVD